MTAVIVAFSFRPMRPTVALALGLIMGGALGNLADRALNGPGFGGPVTDFIDFQVWPIFNVADSAIVIGALLLGVHEPRRFRTSRPRRRRPPPRRARRHQP